MSPQPSHTFVSFSEDPNGRGLFLLSPPPSKKGLGVEISAGKGLFAPRLFFPARRWSPLRPSQCSFPFAGLQFCLCLGEGRVSWHTCPIWGKWRKGREHRKPDQSSDDGGRCPTWTQGLVSDGGWGMVTRSRVLQKEWGWMDSLPCGFKWGIEGQNRVQQGPDGPRTVGDIVRSYCLPRGQRSTLLLQPLPWFPVSLFL